jgi:hypothetical protein
VLREVAYPTTSPDLQEIRYLHPGLLSRNSYRATEFPGMLPVPSSQMSAADEAGCTIAGFA